MLGPPVLLQGGGLPRDKEGNIVTRSRSPRNDNDGRIRIGVWLGAEWKTARFRIGPDAFRPAVIDAIRADAVNDIATLEHLVSERLTVHWVHPDAPGQVQVIQLGRNRSLALRPRQFDRECDL